MIVIYYIFYLIEIHYLNLMFLRVYLFYYYFPDLINSYYFLFCNFLLRELIHLYLNFRRLIHVWLMLYHDLKFYHYLYLYFAFFENYFQY